MAALLAVLPFFAILLYFTPNSIWRKLQTATWSNFAHASFCFACCCSFEMIKDLENLKGDLVNDYKTIPIVYEETSKKIITLLTLWQYSCLSLIEIYDVGYMDGYFYSCLIVLIFSDLPVVKLLQFCCFIIF
jgi:4-hydroxybenzoate polyprenyltransferase